MIVKINVTSQGLTFLLLIVFLISYTIPFGNLNGVSIGYLKEV